MLTIYFYMNYNKYEYTSNIRSLMLYATFCISWISFQDWNGLFKIWINLIFVHPQIVALFNVFNYSKCKPITTNLSFPSVTLLLFKLHILWLCLLLSLNLYILNKKLRDLEIKYKMSLVHRFYNMKKSRLPAILQSKYKGIYFQ